MLDPGTNLAGKLSTKTPVVFQVHQVLAPVPWVSVVCAGVLQWGWRRQAEEGASVRMRYCKRLVLQGLQTETQ